MAKTLSRTLVPRSDRMVLGLAVLFALIAAILVFAALSNAENGGENTTPAASVSVVTAGRDMPARTKLSADMLQVSAVAPEVVLSGSYTAAESLVGLTTRYPLIKGEQVTASKIGETQKDDNSLALVIPPGLRAISIPVQEPTIVGGLLVPGDLVDVIAIFSQAAAGNDKAVTLLQNAEILAVAQEAQRPIPPPLDIDQTAGANVSRGETPGDVKAQPEAQTVTLSVTPAQAQLLALTAENAKLWVTLRARGDAATVELGETDLSGFGIVPVPEQ